MVVDFIEKTIHNSLSYETTWCEKLRIRNPYIDPFQIHFTQKLPLYDMTAYNKYPDLAHIYDKLWIAKSQHKQSGELEKVLNEKNISFPMFIKPRYGHKSASSKGCYKINNLDELRKHVETKDAMWSEFYDGNETMTDYIMVKGKICHQITYEYSPPKNGFTDEWKYISPDNTPPKAIDDWVNKHMKNFSGICNVQYRENSIIEVGMRPARGGAYLQSTNNKNIIKNINNVVENDAWVFLPKKDLSFTPFYSFKCFSKIPIIYLLPQHVMDMLMYAIGAKPFYEYYFEPVGNDGCVFFQFLHENFETGMRIKAMIETLFFLLQILFLVLFILPFIVILKYNRPYIGMAMFLGVCMLFSTTLVNPLSCQYGIWKLFKQRYNITPTKEEHAT